MDWTFLSLVPLIVAIVLLYLAFRAQERFWALGFLGWRKVYAGLSSYFVSGVLSGIWFWVVKVSPESSSLGLLQVGVIITAALGVGLVLAGSIERLRELSSERARLEDIRAGFDLFDSLREIIGQPYAFLEVLDYALKELVRAAGVDGGGLWLYNPGKSEWVLTGWANLSEKLRQQTESVKGTGTGFDRLAASHKARLFSSPEKIRSFFPEWEGEGYHAILGLPLTSGAVGSSGRQILGAIVLADQASDRFDDDRARRLYAASDYVAAVIAEARMTRQLDSTRQQIDAAYAELARERDLAARQKQESNARLEQLEAEWEAERRALEEKSAATIQGLTESFEQKQRDTAEQNAARLQELKSQAAAELHRVQSELEARLATEAERVEQLRQRWEEARKSSQQLEQRLAEERRTWEQRLDQLHAEWQQERDETRQHSQAQAAKHQEHAVAAERTIAELKQKLIAEERLLATAREDTQNARALVTERDEALAEARQRHERMEFQIGELQAQLEAQTQATNEQRAIAAEAHATIAERDAALAGERQGRRDDTARFDAVQKELTERLSRLEAKLLAAQTTVADQQRDLEARVAAIGELEAQLGSERETHAGVVAELREQYETLRRTTTDDLEKTRNELQRVQSALEERGRLLEQHHAGEQRALAEIDRLTEASETARTAAAATIAELEERLQNESAARESLEQEIASQREEWEAHEARQQRELVEERLEHRRRLHNIEIRTAAMEDRLCAAMAVPDAGERLGVMMGYLREQLPAATEFFLWQRLGQETPRMLLWMDQGGRVHQGQSLPPWPFELHTIPAEGITRLTQDGAWPTARGQQGEPDVLKWSQHWGPEREPVWAICWPWSAGPGGANGWITAFGFEPVQATDEQIAEAETWVRLVGAAVPGADVPVVSEVTAPVLTADPVSDVVAEVDTTSADPASADGTTPDADTDDVAPHPEETHADDSEWDSETAPDSEPEDAGDDPKRPDHDSLSVDDDAPAACAAEDAASIDDINRDAHDEVEDDTLPSLYTDLPNGIASIPGEEFMTPPPPATDAESAADGSAATGEMVSVAAGEDDEGGEAPTAESDADDDVPSTGDLHHVIIEWAAGQTDDALRLDLNARPAQHGVNSGWLRRILEQGRATCRAADTPGEEFTVSTSRENGHTVLRFLRGSESPGANADLAAVDDTDLSHGPSTEDSGDSSASAPQAPVSGRWLLHDGSRIGMELRFVAEQSADTTETAPPVAREETVVPDEINVLVADDQGVMGELLTGMLESLGYRVHFVNDTEQMEEYLDDEHVDAAVFDTTMSDDNGWEMARQFKYQASHIPILLIIGADMADVPDDVSADWLLRMPFQIEELHDCMMAMCDVRTRETTAGNA